MLRWDMLRAAGICGAAVVTEDYCRLRDEVFRVDDGVAKKQAAIFADVAAQENTDD